jgi:hypothetical protein
VFDFTSREHSIHRLRGRLNQLENYSQLYSTYRELPVRLASPVSAILGAADIVAQKLAGVDSELSHYNSIIRRSARTMIDDLKKYEHVKESLKID